jgi:hypothetical protein
MKQYILPLLGVALVTIQSCKEIGPFVDMSSAVASDTTYTVDAGGVTPELRRVLVEEATGVKCPNCPAGAEALKAQEDAHPGRLIIVALHAGFLTTPLDSSKYDFRTTFSKDIMEALGGEPSKPAASFDRDLQSTGYFVDRNVWGNVITDRLAAASPVKMQLTSSYDDVKKEAVINIKVTYTQEVAKQQNLTVLITESGMVDPQDDNRKPPPYVKDYVHNHVLRDMLTPVTGSGMIDTIAVKKVGRVYERTFIYKLPENAFEYPEWNPANLSVIAFVHNNEPSDKEVAQAVEAHLKP